MFHPPGPAAQLVNRGIIIIKNTRIKHFFIYLYIHLIIISFQFILFYTPYSALYWESIYRDGELKKQIQMEKIATELMLECDNIKLFDFCRETQITDNVNYYRDKEHYVAEINDLIMRWIAEGRGRITKENYKDILQWELDYYMNYNYDNLYVGYEQYMQPER